MACLPTYKGKRYNSIEELIKENNLQDSINKKKGLKHIEVMLPSWTKSFFTDFTKENGDIDIEKINMEIPEALDMLGYRIPTEDKYSMAPMRVVGFLPETSGGAIMLPTDITRISGSDFDVDKMYVLMKTFRKKGGRSYTMNNYSETANQEEYSRYIHENSSKDDISYIRYLAKHERKRSNQEFQDKYEELLKSLGENYRESFSRFKNNITADGIGDVKQYIGELNDTRKNILRVMSSRSRGEFADLKEYLDDNNIRGAARVAEYLSLSYEIANDEDASNKDRDFANDLTTIHNEELRMYGVKDEAIKEFNRISNLENKESISDFSEQQSAAFKNIMSESLEILREQGDLMTYEKFEEEFNANPVKWNGKKARDNRKVDLMLSVLQNPNTIEAILDGGNFDYLKDLSRATNNALGIADDNLNPMSLNSMDKMHLDNMAGKTLVGIAANETTFNSIAQHANLKLKKDVLFDGNKLNSLSNQETDKVYDLESMSFIQNVKRKISKVKAFYSAAVVDNAADPVARHLNYNSYTAGVTGLLTQLGLDPATVTWFLKQPIVMRITEEFFAAGGDLSSETEIIEKYKAELGLPKKDGDPVNLNTVELFNNLNKDYKDSSQKDVLQSFIAYKKLAGDWTSLILASTADTKGAGPTQADSEVILHSIKRAMAENFSISGVIDLFNTESDNSRYVAAFTDLGIRKPNEIMSKLLPYSTQGGVYMAAKNILTSYIKNRDLTAKERNLINDQMTSYLLSKFTAFNADERNYYLNKFPEEFLEMSKNNSIFENNYLIRRLTYNSKLSNKNIPIERIIFNNTGSLTNEEKDDIQNAWMDLYENKETRELAEKLMTYSYFTTGLSFGVNGFAHLLPVDMLTDRGVKAVNGMSLAEHMHFINNTNRDLRTESMYFIDQFYRNFHKNKTFVPRVNKEFSNVSNTVRDDKGKIIGFNVNYKTVKNKSFVIEEGRDGVLLSKFIALENKNGEISLFRLHDDNGTYLLTNKLGFPNNVVEYTAKDQDIKSVLEVNNEDEVTIEDFNKAKNSVKTKPSKKYTPAKEIYESVNAGIFDSIRSEVQIGETYKVELEYDGKQYVFIKDNKGDLRAFGKENPISKNSEKSKLFRRAVAENHKLKC